MPEMVDIASHFDDIEALDAYTGLLAFVGQFNTYDETAVDGNTEKKRSLSVRPGTVIPARRVVTIFGESWIVGDGNTDGIYNTAIRTAYWLKRADEIATLRSPAQALAGFGGTTLHINKTFFKDIQNGVTDTDYDAFWEVFTSKTESAVVGKIVISGSKLLRVRGFHQELSGFGLMMCDELAKLDSLTVKPANAVFDPITETWSGVPVAVATYLVDGYKMYKYFSQSDVKVNAGDLYAVVAASVKPGSEAVHSTLGKFKVNQVRPELDAFVLHLVKA